MIELELVHTMHSFEYGVHVQSMCERCQDEQQAKLTIKQVLRTIKPFKCSDWRRHPGDKAYVHYNVPSETVEQLEETISDVHG